MVGFLDMSPLLKVVFFPTFTKISFPRRQERVAKRVKSFRCCMHAVLVIASVRVGLFWVFSSCADVRIAVHKGSI